MIDVLYEDNHLIAVDKKGNLLTQPDRTKKNNLEDLTKAYLKKKYQKTGGVYLHPIHRLDRQAKGIVLFAKTTKALSRLNESMRKKEIKKHYLARVEGLLEKKEGVIECYLMHDRFIAKAFVEAKPKAKLSKLIYKVKEKKDNQTLLDISLETGRYHQIRAQLQFIGHPIVGDKKYGATTHKNEIALLHYKMEFFHPVTKEKLILLSKQTV